MNSIIKYGAQEEVMSAYLKQQIQDRMEEKNLSIYALEKKAGLNRSAVRNIIQGFSKKPSADILRAIAIVLECTLDDLVGPLEASNNSTTKNISKARESYMWNEKLYLDVVKTISELAMEKMGELKLEQITPLISEAYKYSMGKTADKADQDFCKWLVSKGF